MVLCDRRGVEDVAPYNKIHLYFIIPYKIIIVNRKIRRRYKNLRLILLFVLFKILNSDLVVNNTRTRLVEEGKTVIIKLRQTAVPKHTLIYIVGVFPIDSIAIVRGGIKAFVLADKTDLYAAVKATAPYGVGNYNGILAVDLPAVIDDRNSFCGNLSYDLICRSCSHRASSRRIASTARSPKTSGSRDMQG